MPSCLPTVSNHTSTAQHVAPTNADLLKTIWQTFLSHVHPLVKVFFDWDIEPLIHRVHTSLSEGDLVLAITFISTLSLSPSECSRVLKSNESKDQILHRLQGDAESVLVAADYATSTDHRTFQALMLYLIAMRDRADPAALFSLMGLASRVAVRMGLHRDGELLGLSVVRAEERRRMWWQLQFMEIAIARLVGSLSLGLFAEWDSRMPLNCEDGDFFEGGGVPRERKGLTSMSQCLWRYDILSSQRQMRHQPSLAATEVGAGAVREDLLWLLSAQIPLSTKDAKVDVVEQMLGAKYLQHCELVNPLHVYIQVGIRQFLLTCRRTVRQPGLVNAKISSMSRAERDEFLHLCVKGLEYYVLSQTSEMLERFRWGNESYFQGASFVYVILEAHHRAEEHEGVGELWELLRKVYEVHPDLSAKHHHHRPEIASMARITLAAWQKYDAQRQPDWIVELCDNFGLWDIVTDEDTDMQYQLQLDASRLLGVDFDFDTFDWTIWGDSNHLPS
jgi:hypothetical protein